MEEIKTASEQNCDCYLCDGCGEVETVDRESNRVTVPCPECMSREIAEERAEAAVLSANAGKVDEDVLSDLAVTAFSKWQEKEGMKSVDQCKSFCAGYMYASADRIETTQQAIDAGKV